MELNFQDITIFTYSLLAFLPIARSVTLVFQKQFHGNKQLMDWYESKVKEWEDNKIMKFFIEMRNVSLKEHTPKMKLTRTVPFTVDAILVRKVSPDGKIEQTETQSPCSSTEQSKEREQHAQPSPRVVRYSFHELPEWFDDNPDVMRFCKKYLEELEKFVIEAESMIKGKE